MWSLFDVQFGQSRETMGTCFLRIAELTEMPVGLRTTDAALQASRLASYIMKHGSSANHWNEYIFCAYTGHCKEAVFLTGIPDIKESLPHA